MTNQTKPINHTEIVKLTADYVESELKYAEGGHDWYHIQRVWKNALYIAKKEGKGDLLIIELAALLHDIADAKFYNGDESIGPQRARTFLSSIDVDENVIDHVVKIIEHISFRKRHLNGNFKSIELQIVQDADRLDAIGAIGIARVFNFGGFKNRPLYEPFTKDVNGTVNGKAVNDRKHTIGHFYEKLLLLNELMNTKTGRQLAEERHDFMVKFLEQFYKEWNGLE